MNREVKFRGLRTDGKGWVYGSLVNFIEFICIFPHEADWYDIVQLDRRISPEYQVIPESVGQFTGLKDKNGVEIYENDIIKDGTGRILTIQWSPKFASFCLNSKDWTFLHYFGEACDANDVEIIGNIHENPELL